MNTRNDREARRSTSIAVFDLYHYIRPQLFESSRPDAGDAAAEIIHTGEGLAGAFIDDSLGHFRSDARQLFEFRDRRDVDVDRFGWTLSGLARGSRRRWRSIGSNQRANALEPAGTEHRDGAQLVGGLESAALVADAGDSIGERRADTRQLQELSAIGAIEIESGRAKLEWAGRRAEEPHRQKRAADAEQKGGGKLSRPRPWRSDIWSLLGGHRSPPGESVDTDMLNNESGEIQRFLVAAGTQQRQ